MIFIVKIYFAGSIRGEKANKDIFKSIIEHLKKYGIVLTEHVANVDEEGEKKLQDEHIYKRDVSWISESDVFVAEVTKPSLGVGYEICKAEYLGIPILCLYQQKEEGRLSAMISGNEKLCVKMYSELDEVKGKIDEFMEHFCCI